MVEKLLIAILGFLLGISSQIIVKINNEQRKKIATLDLVRAEVKAFIKACEHAKKHKFWDSIAVEALAKQIVKNYSQNNERFISITDQEKRRGIIDFYLEANAYLLLLERHRKSENKDPDGSSLLICAASYENIVERSKKFLENL